MTKQFMQSGDDPILGGQQKAEDMLRMPSASEVDAEVFGGVIPDAGRKVAKPIPLSQISPDPAQPRREVPARVRAAASKANMPEWSMWRDMAAKARGKRIELAPLLRGEGEGAELDPVGDPLVDGFLSLVALASSIYRDGLVNAITVTQRGIDQHVIETGERRYQAFVMIHGVFGEDKFAKIPAHVVPKSDVWRQAAENGSRKPLNAIGMARQLALLIMDLNRGEGGMVYDPFEKLVLPGECDRRFYAQVANGVVHRIPKGMSERILQTTGLKSRDQIRHYRALLNIPDEMWMQADEEDWAEGKIRLLINPPRDDMSTIVDISGDEAHAPAEDDTAHDRDLYLREKRVWWINDSGVREEGEVVSIHRKGKGPQSPGVLMVSIRRADGTFVHVEGERVQLVDETPAPAAAQEPTPTVEKQTDRRDQWWILRHVSWMDGEKEKIGTVRAAYRVAGVLMLQISHDATGKFWEMEAEKVKLLPVAQSSHAPTPPQTRPASQIQNDLDWLGKEVVWKTLGSDQEGIVRGAYRVAGVLMLKIEEKTTKSLWERAADKVELLRKLPGVPHHSNERLPQRQEEMLVALYRNAGFDKNPATRMALEEKGMIHIQDRHRWIIALAEAGLAYLRDVMGLPIAAAEDKTVSANTDDPALTDADLSEDEETDAGAPVRVWSPSPVADGDMGAVIEGLLRIAQVVGRQEASQALMRLLRYSDSGIAIILEDSSAETYGNTLQKLNTDVQAFLTDCMATINSLCETLYQRAFEIEALVREG